MKPYTYRPLRFYMTCFAVTWAFWIAAAFISRTANDNGISMVFMLLGLMAPPSQRSSPYWPPKVAPSSRT